VTNCMQPEQMNFVKSGCGLFERNDTISVYNKMHQHKDSN
jgi:hypothetical protein